MRALTALIFSLLLAAQSRATESIFATAGQSSSLQKRESSAWVAALGGNGASLNAGVDSLLSNPAALARIKGFEVGMHHQSWLADILQENLAVAGPGLWGGAWGAAFGLVDYGKMEAVDEFGQPLGGISAQDYNLSLAWARAAGAGFSVGGSMRAAQEVLAGEASTAFSLDLGLHWQRPGWQLGLVFADVGSAAFGASRGPSAVRGEFSGDLTPKAGALRVNSGFSLEPSGLNRLQVGLEAGLSAAFVARVGYEGRLGATLLEGFNSASFGLGVALGSTVLDYAFQPYGDLGAGHRVSLKWRLN